ncbi:MAG: SDR family oxidoreductase [Ignavibacteriales bacterium]|nr:SDR family oxidoreductase [Ignavibacteriales bacterium]
MKMNNKIALVTGGSRGLGKDMALSLADKNIDVILTYNNSKVEAEEVVAEIKSKNQKAAAIQFDISQMNSIDPFLNNVREVLKNNWETDKFDFLINNAGVGATIPIPQVTEEAFDNLMNIHFKGVYFLTQKSLPMMNDNGGVIFISSGTTRFCVPGYSVYSSLKAAVEVFTKYVAKEFGSRGIRANIVAPGAIETDFNNAAIRNNPQMQTFLASQTPLGRVGRADDIGSVVAFLCTPESKWINGQRIEVSGGINL